MTYPDYVLDHAFTGAVRKALGLNVPVGILNAELSVGGKPIGTVSHIAFKAETVYGLPIVEHDGPCNVDGCGATGKHWHLADGGP